MVELKKGGIYKIRLVNLLDKSVWIHNRVPTADISCLALNKNLIVEVLKLVEMEEKSGHTNGSSRLILQPRRKV